MLFTDGIISVQPPETTASCEVKDTQKSWDHPIGCEIRGSALRILGKKDPERARRQKEENAKQIETINEPLSDQAELADGSGAVQEVGISAMTLFKIIHCHRIILYIQP